MLVPVLGSATSALCGAMLGHAGFFAGMPAMVMPPLQGI